MMQMNLSTKQTPKEQTCGCQVERGAGEGWIESLELADASVREWINDSVLLYSTENYIQYPVIMEKNMKKNAYIHLCIYMYV